MNTNKKTPVIIGVLVIFIALIVVISQQNSKNKPAPSVPTNNPSVSNNTFTMADVAIHKSQSDCWTVVDGAVYDVTSWISKHPGGAGAIVSMCGVDASSAFIDQHSGERRPANELAGFKIGTLK